jgi:photosystem II stability/assembly factor-like uncharacterized protein
LKKIIAFTVSFAASISLLIHFSTPELRNESGESVKKQHFDGPAEFAKFQRDIRTAEGKTAPDYRLGYRLRELAKAEQRAAQFQARTKTGNGVIAFTERGPNNVPGRTRGLIVDPDDANKNTWYAGSAGGGIWKTTNAGQSWTNLTPELSNLATTVLAMAESNHNVIYTGTGEGFFNLDAINGSGVYKSTDRGVTWSLLSSTTTFGDVNRIAVSPSDANLLCVAASTGIYRSTDGGTSWTKTLNETNIQDLKATPGNFNVLYATQNSVAVWKSVDAGLTWDESSSGMGAFGRVELAISPTNPNRIFASAEEEAFDTGSLLFMSNDAALTWSFVGVEINGSKVDFLNEQGWYDNTIACDPFNENIVYFGGVDLFRSQITSGSTTLNIIELEESNTSTFLDLINFGGTDVGGAIDAGPQANNTSVEIRFGPGQTQKAHRFLVPQGATSGVAAANYSFQDYVDVPFTVWDITSNPDRQLMVSFRDQGRDGTFNLINSNTSSSVATEQSREYIFINNVTYNASAPNNTIAANGGHEFNEMYNFWPVLPVGGTWPPASNGALQILSTSVQQLNASTINITDGRGTFGNGKNNNVHVDHHNIVMIPMSASTYKILNANDGGVFVSNTSATPGINNNEWTGTGNGYNSSQFYGADKRTGANEYFGGMQDNGTWLSPAGQSAAAGSNYTFKIGGDGFEVIWNNLNTQLLIGGSQGNGFARSVNGGLNFSSATAGLSGEFPFISKLANSRSFPDRIFALGGSGVFVSNNFGQNWTLTPITQKWINSSLMDVEVSCVNAEIVWAGAGMTGSLNLHVSTDGGKTFTITNNFTTVTMGGITKLASHPTEANTAYALFSLAGKPKILKTTDLGQSWIDISGFGTNPASSSGFPDVAVYCLYVRPDNANIIWVGTEIGIVESLDGGATWALLTNFPNVSVWDMKGVDDQIVIATHGRGIWTATIDAQQSELIDVPTLTAGTNPNEKLSVLLTSTGVFDSVQVLIGGSRVGSFKNPVVGETLAEISGISFGVKTLSGIAYKNGAPYATNTQTVRYHDLSPVRTSFSDYFTSLTNFNVTSFLLNIFAEQSPSARRTLHTKSNYDANAAYEAFLLVPIEIRNANANFSYRDVAIVEPENDFVVIEATTDGVHWVELQNRYDATKNTGWLSTFNTTNGKGAYSQMVAHEVDLLSLFNPGQKVLFRLRLVSNNTIQSWGWAIDYIAIQEEPSEAEYTTIDPSISVYPNPTATAQAYLQFKLTEKSDVDVKVINVLGSTVGSMVKKDMIPGDHITPLPVGHLPAGTYIVTVQKEGKKETTRLVLE